MTTSTVQELTFGTADRSPFARDEAERRACVRALGRCVAPEDRPGVVGFCLRGDRLRVMVVDRAERVGYLRGALLRALRRVVRARLALPDVRPLGHRAHGMGVLRHYVAPQEPDGFGIAAPLATGSCLADLLGARRVPGMRLVAAQVLPRLHGRDLLAMVALDGVALLDAGGICRVGASRAVSAAAFAIGVPTIVTGLGAGVVAARRVVVRVAVEAGIAGSEVARALGVTPRTLRRLAGGPVDERLDRAVRMRLAIEEAVLRQTVGTALSI